MTYEKQAGFTIVELLIAVTVGTIVVSTMMFITLTFYGSLVREQVRSRMVIESQLFLRKMTEDVRLANSVNTINSIADPSNTGGWTTSDPANILIITSPAVDSNKDLIYDTATGLPYQNEIIYFGSGSTMYRRLLANTDAPGNSAITTCSSGCPPDIKLSENLQNLTFAFYDQNNAVTTNADLARSVSLTVNLTKKVYGEFVSINNTVRTTLRNEN